MSFVRKTTTSICTNSPNWEDSAGYNCDWYAEEENRCSEWGTCCMSQGYVAKTACCSCNNGVGSQYLANCRDISSSAAVANDNHSDVLTQQWTDIFGRNCSWYGDVDEKLMNDDPWDTRCRHYGQNYENYGYTAVTACCICGGGRIIINDDIINSTVAPSSFLISSRPLPTNSSSYSSFDPSSTPSIFFEDSNSPTFSSLPPSKLQPSSAPSTKPFTTKPSFYPSMRPSAGIIVHTSTSQRFEMILTNSTLLERQTRSLWESTTNSFIIDYYQTNGGIAEDGNQLHILALETEIVKQIPSLSSSSIDDSQIFEPLPIVIVTYEQSIEYWTKSEKLIASDILLYPFSSRIRRDLYLDSYLKAVSASAFTDVVRVSDFRIAQSNEVDDCSPPTATSESSFIDDNGRSIFIYTMIAGVGVLSLSALVILLLWRNNNTMNGATSAAATASDVNNKEHSISASIGSEDHNEELGTSRPTGEIIMRNSTYEILVEDDAVVVVQ